MKEVERICRESNCYDPERVKNFLKVQSPPPLPKFPAGVCVRMTQEGVVSVFLFLVMCRKPS